MSTCSRDKGLEGFGDGLRGGQPTLYESRRGRESRDPFTLKGSNLHSFHSQSHHRSPPARETLSGPCSFPLSRTQSLQVFASIPIAHPSHSRAPSDA